MSKTRCPGSRILLTDTVASKSDPYHHYSATCPHCDRTFLLPSFRLAVHYVTVEPAAPAETLEESMTTHTTPLFANTRQDVLVDAYLITAHRPSCETRWCHQRASYQVRREDVYDGFWRQACSKHLADAVDQVTALPLHASLEANA